MTPTNAPRSSNEALVLNVSHLLKAHGAFVLSKLVANQRACLVDCVPLVAHPPMATTLPSALVSSRKTSPSSLALDRHFDIRELFNSFTMYFMISNTMRGNRGRAYLGPTQAYE